MQLFSGLCRCEHTEKVPKLYCKAYLQIIVEDIYAKYAIVSNLQLLEETLGKDLSDSLRMVTYPAILPLSYPNLQYLLVHIL